jgi:aspartate/methionine/tyrosine aminotransferase
MHDIGTENAFKIGPHIVKVESGGTPVVKLNLGEPDFSAPRWVKNEVIKRIEQDDSHYCNPKGIPSFRKAIADQINQTRGLNVTAEHVCVFPGGKPSIGFSQQIYCNPGHEIIYPGPGFPIYESFIVYFGAVPVPLYLQEEKKFHFYTRATGGIDNAQDKTHHPQFPFQPYRRCGRRGSTRGHRKGHHDQV